MVREGLIPELDFKSNNCKRYHKTFWQKSTLFYIFLTFPFVFGGIFYIFAFRNYSQHPSPITQQPMAGIYAHIPFCKSRCIYCGFYSSTLLSMQDDYVDAMLRELDSRKDYLVGEPVTTIYIGGGTPSMLSTKNLSRLCQRLKEFANGTLEEFTVECNPDDVTPELASLLFSLGVNRVSMGAQTFSDERLAFIHRRHKAHQVKEAVENLRNAGIRNISIDLMFGFPDETVENWKCDIEQALSLGVQHISAYSLMYEEGTALYKLLEEGKIKEISEEASLEMYETLITLLTQAGYEHYEISNFALPGYRSKHNSSYWKRVPYLGIGAAAHSYNLTSRQWNISNVKLYIEGNNIVEDCELLDSTEQYNDLITTALRTREGIDLGSLSETDILFLTKAASKSIEQGNLIIENNHLHLTRKGIFISDAIMVELIK